MSNEHAVHWVVDEDRIFTDMPDNPCTACGACCAIFRVSFYCGELTGGSGGVVPAELASKVNDTMACMKGTEQGHGRCIALVGELGQRGIGCSIYQNRPSTCREFSAWDADGQPNATCARLRAGLGLAPLAPVAPALVSG
ncbi:YkgJ family cysteine cluster protein [Herbaspirillum sp. LeCh32-8]|nr:YkgJ family cysteine cluster protein [Herbaspirillum sp. LeCh32-8]